MDKLLFDYVELINLNFYKIAFKPIICEESFAHNIANIIRQSLFNNIHGYAATEISFLKPVNEFSYLPGLKEDITNFILNIKNIVFRLKKKKKIFIKLFSSKNVVKASDIKLNNFVEIKNPNIIICNLNDNFSIKLIIKIEKGKGYIPFNSDKRYRGCSDMKYGILIDSFFNPILRVSYSIKNINDYLYSSLKKIIFFIETNGLIDGKKALVKAIDFILKKFLNFINLNKKKFNYNFFLNNNSNIFLSLFDSDFTFRTIKYLYRLKIYNLNDILKYKIDYFLNVSFFSNKTLKEIKSILKKYNFLKNHETLF